MHCKICAKLAPVSAGSPKMEKCHEAHFLCVIGSGIVFPPTTAKHKIGRSRLRTKRERLATKQHAQEIEET